MGHVPDRSQQGPDDAAEFRRRVRDARDLTETGSACGGGRPPQARNRHPDRLSSAAVNYRASMAKAEHGSVDIATPGRVLVLTECRTGSPPD